MNLSECSELKQFFLGKLKENNATRRVNIHVSDLIYCLKESYFKRTQPKPPTPKQLGFYVDGARRHIVLEVLSDLKREVEVKKYSVVGHVDILKDSGGPIEIKTTRTREKLPDHYFLQLGFYATMLNVNHGYLIIQRLMNEDPWEFYRVEWTEEEMMNLDYELYSRANLLRTALEKNEPSLLSRPDASTNWKCKNCQFSDLCQKT